MRKASRKVTLNPPKDGGGPTAAPSEQRKDPYMEAVQQHLVKRRQAKLVINEEDLTPKFCIAKKITITFADKLAKFLKGSVSKEDLEDLSDSKLSYSLKASMDEIMASLSLSVVSTDEVPVWRMGGDKKGEAPKPEPLKPTPFIKVILRETNDVLLFEKGSITVLKESDEAARVEKDNARYDELTIGKARMRRKADSEAQTVDVLYKTRHANTDKIRKVEAGTYVSNFDMFDTYQELEQVTTSVDMPGGKQKMEITTYRRDGVDQFAELVTKPNFQLATMLTQRLLAGNVFKDNQKRFRNMDFLDPLSLNVKYLYRLKTLWVLPGIAPYGVPSAVAAMSWCPKNGDILAVAYGIYTCVKISDANLGLVGIWSIKNPVNPERVYRYPVPVVSVEFSSSVPQLLAIGLYDGTIEIRDISTDVDGAVAVSHRDTSPGSEPVAQMKWSGGHDARSERLFSVSPDGSIMKYQIVSSPFLLGFLQMRLSRVVGSPEGLLVIRTEPIIEANRNPRCLGIKMHPAKANIYFVLTDEGCLHKCSTNYPHQHLEVMQVHDGSVFEMDFSPWSPKLFLTCGSDWCIRIWLEGIFEPIIRLSSGIGPVHCAYWSRTHSTVIVGVTRSAVEVWDIRRSTLKPVSSQKLGAENRYLTEVKFSNCGRSIAIGNEEGKVTVCSLEDMPFPPYFQYKELENSIFRAIKAFPELSREVKSLGPFGYPEKSKVKLPITEKAAGRERIM